MALGFGEDKQEVVKFEENIETLETPKKGFFKRLFQSVFKAETDEDEQETDEDAENITKELALPTEQEADAIENTVYIKGNMLYEFFSAMNGTEPVEDEEATFHLSVFIEHGNIPTVDQRNWLKNMEREASTRLSKNRSEKEEALDCSVIINIPSDRMSAWVYLLPPLFAGVHVTPEMITTALEAKGVKFGIYEEIIDAICEKRKYFIMMQISAGVPCVDGQDGEIVDIYRREHEIQLKVKEDNTIDYKDLGWLQIIRQEELICDIVLPTLAVSGTDVCGAEIKGRNGRKAAAPKGQNTVINEDETALLATIDGVVSFAGQRFRVDPLLIINGNIDTGTGNLTVVGDLLINGDVQEGFKVEASGNITVQGMVEGAQILSGGNIQVGRGMNGNSHGNLVAKGAVRSKFLENSNVTAGAEIICDTIINSSISSDTVVEVKTGRGAIIGGSITALKMIDAKTIGNQSNRSTTITLGSTANLLREKQNAEQRYQEAASEVDEINKNIMFLNRGGVIRTPEMDKMSDELMLKLKIQKMQLAKLAAQLAELTAKQVDDTECRLRAEAIYPPVQISIGSFTKVFRENLFNALVYCKNGEVHVANV